MLKSILAASIVIALTSCSTTSTGSVAVGMKGSKFWNDSAPKQDIVAYYDNMRLPELCLAFKRHAAHPVVIRNITESLVRRGESEDRCFELLGNSSIAETSRTSTPVDVPPAQPKTVTCTSYPGRTMVQTYCN